ncbi:MAG TPA: GTP 3',8-cyclase MoaA [Mycobacteriales bacterium]|nr:GTP 3',8-cyclase MoaA [Mycobacteriales bacterium]
MPDLVDGYGRVVRDVRVSLTDRCGLRCTYCMPAEGLPWLPRQELLTDAELLRVTGILAGLGVRSARLTGGEPLLRPGVAAIVRGLVGQGYDTALTTNGVALAGCADDLAAAGLKRVNVSLDTLQRSKFHAITHRDRFVDVMAGLAAAATAGLTPVKVNAVLLRGVNDTEAVDLLSFCLDRGYELRFIEQMPLDPQHSWDRSQLVTGEEILARLRARWSLQPEPRTGSAPAETWLVDGGPARVGVVASVTAPFCSSCDRLRLTADGQLRNCLFSRTETDLRGPLRSGATDAELVELITASVRAKAAGHGIDDPAFLQPVRPMSAIGG